MRPSTAVQLGGIWRAPTATGVGADGAASTHRTQTDMRKSMRHHEPTFSRSELRLWCCCAQPSISWQETSDASTHHSGAATNRSSIRYWSRVTVYAPVRENESRSMYAATLCRVLEWAGCCLGHTFRTYQIIFLLRMEQWALRSSFFRRGGRCVYTIFCIRMIDYSLF